MKYLVIGLILIVAIAIGVSIGVFIGLRRMQKAVEERSVGHLRIDRSELHEPPKAFLELVGTSIESVSKKEFVVLRVINEDYLSRD